jgi:hypothetical protein
VVKCSGAKDKEGEKKRLVELHFELIQGR